MIKTYVMKPGVVIDADISMDGNGVRAIQFINDNDNFITDEFIRDVQSMISEHCKVVYNRPHDGLRASLVFEDTTKDLTVYLDPGDYIIVSRKVPCIVVVPKEKFEDDFINNTYDINSIFRGDCLGTEITKEQREVILNKSYKGLHIGDYWEKDGIKWRIGEFGRKTPDGLGGKDSLITIVPDETLFITRSTTIDKISRMFKLARNMFSELFDDFDFITYLMNERMVFGKSIHSDDELNHHAYDNEKQLALFNLNQECVISDDSYWLDDVARSFFFMFVDSNGLANYHYAGHVGGVRPAFFIYDQKNNKKHDE